MLKLNLENKIENKLYNNITITHVITIDVNIPTIISNGLIIFSHDNL